MMINVGIKKVGKTHNYKDTYLTQNCEPAA